MLLLDLARLYFILVFENSAPLVKDILIVDWQVSKLKTTDKVVAF